MTKFDQWVRDAVKDAKAKDNSALPNNRRVRSTGHTASGSNAVLDRYVRGTLVTLGSIDVVL